MPQLHAVNRTVPNGSTTVARGRHHLITWAGRSRRWIQFEPVIAWLLAVVAVGLVLLFRDAVARVLVVLIAMVVRLFGGVMWVRRTAIRRRRRRQRSNKSQRQHRVSGEHRRGSVYDDIPL